MKRVRGVIVKDGKLILIKRIKPKEVYYVFPGGGVEKGENNIEALKRECREELGVDVEAKKLMSKINFNGQQEYFYFCSITGGKIGTGNGPEYDSNSHYEGKHVVEVVDLLKIKDKDLRPLSAKNEILSLIIKCIRLSNTERFGKIKTQNNEYFFKILSSDEAKKEMAGYNRVKKFYPVANYLFSIDYGEKVILLYEYEKFTDLKDGLLVDYFVNNSKTDRRYSKILKLYKNIFLKTVKRDHGECSNVFFRDRIKTRINKYYPSEFINAYKNIELKINGNKIRLDIEKIFKELRKYFKTKKKIWTVISQCDPGDLNICTKPLIFDYLGGGRVPFMAEFAIFFWYNLVQGSYLSPTYNPPSFKGHKLILRRLDKITVNRSSIRHHISPIRREAIRLYINHVVRPVIQKIGSFDSFYLEFKNYLAMRIMAVFNVSKMKQKDKFLCLAYLQYFYEDNPKKLEDFINHIKKLWLEE